MNAHIYTHTHTTQINVCSHVLRVRLATITEVECRKAVHGGKKGKLESAVV